MRRKHTPVEYVDNIRQSRLDIYAPIEIGDPKLWIPAKELEILLTEVLAGKQFADMPNRTRSKAIKSIVCEAMGYPVVKSFKRSKPQFPGQRVHIHSQKCCNLQIYNQQIDPICRYAVIVLSPQFTVTKVRVLSGEELALLDNTGTLTRKYQARIISGNLDTELLCDADTNNLRQITSRFINVKSFAISPTAHPLIGQLMPIQTIYNRLTRLIGSSFVDAGIDQERNRGGELHRRVCTALGYQNHEEDGTFPDIRHQLVEVKLQISPTIDLGLVSPDSEEPLDTPRLSNIQARHCDVRYVIFYANRSSGNVILTKLYVSTGESFFTRFKRFGGLVVNTKQQIHLPNSFFQD